MWLQHWCQRCGILSQYHNVSREHEVVLRDGLSVNIKNKILNSTYFLVERVWSIHISKHNLFKKPYIRAREQLASVTQTCRTQQQKLVVRYLCHSIILNLEIAYYSFSYARASLHGKTVFKMQSWTWLWHTSNHTTLLLRASEREILSHIMIFPCKPTQYVTIT